MKASLFPKEETAPLRETFIPFKKTCHNRQVFLWREIKKCKTEMLIVLFSNFDVFLRVNKTLSPLSLNTDKPE
jgi:hypothetical protein